MTDFKHGDVVKICRPNKKEHGWVGRFIEPIQVNPGNPFGWVAFNKAKEERTAPPPTTDLHKQDKYPRTFFPLSQILLLELTS
jgi:hypothetical protein